jgi:FKBP-type peptidyl-prolyl cis-trans isomerase FklB
MKNWKYILLSVILFPLVGMVSSCSEESAKTGEFDNWQQRNDEAVNQWAANTSLRKIKTFSKDPSSTGTNADYIYVQVLETGNGADSPLFNDTARVAYRGYFIPTASYSDGYVFDQNYIGDFNWSTAGMTDFAITSSLCDGFSTALMNMHKGDRWRVYMPYQLGYGTTVSGSIPAYSNLIFDIALQDCWHPGDVHPSFKARKK